MPRTRARLALMVALLIAGAPGGVAEGHDILGWWKYDPAFWHHDFREHPELRPMHRRWHDAHPTPKHAGTRLDRWRRRHHRLHHLRLDHPHQDLHYHEAVERQSGQATWYDLEEETGACGAPLRGLYAAHPSWPCGSLVSVRTDSRYVFVRVLDRGPFGEGRVIDLSLKAFARLADPSQGVLDVKIYRLAEHGTP